MTKRCRIIFGTSCIIRISTARAAFLLSTKFYMKIIVPFPVSISFLIFSFLTLSVFTTRQHLLQYFISVAVILFFHFIFITQHSATYVFMFWTWEYGLINFFFCFLFNHFIPYYMV